MNYSNYLMACTVFAQTLRLDAVVFALLREWTFLQLQVTLAGVLPFDFHHSCLPHLLLSWPSQTSPITVVAEPRCVMMMTMSHLCLSRSLQKLYVVRLGLLYFCVKSWHNKKKSMLKRDWTEQRHYGKKAMLAPGLWDLCWWQSIVWSLLSQFLVWSLWSQSLL